MSVNIIGRTAIGIAAKFPFLSRTSLCATQSAGLVSKALRDLDYTRPLPYPYKKKDYKLFHAWFDKTTWRFDENSKIVVVDGPVAVGKDKFALELAKNLDMVYIPNAHLDAYYINAYGFDDRSMNEHVPDSCKTWDIEDFLQNPTGHKTTRMQNLYMQIRIKQYIDALAHVLSTGQGVVMNRSIYSDFIFVDTMHKFGYITKEYRNYYYKNLEILIPTLMRPHLCIYLDIPVEESIKRINKRNRPGEKNSPFYRPEVLKHMETLYKENYLKDIRSHAEILAYDWTENIDVEEVVEDCERVNLDEYSLHDPKMNDWRLIDEAEWNARRMSYTSYRDEIEIWMNHIPVLDCPELYVPAMDAIQLDNIRENAPGYKYADGYNKELGDTGVWIKNKTYGYWRV